MDSSDLWVFGYGSLMWNPGFTPVEHQLAVLRDYHRSFCMWSIHHRGSEAEPGLVLALDAEPGARCTGLALRVHSEEREAVLAELRARELISSAYVERICDLALTNGQTVKAVTYVIEKTHVQYCAGMALERQAEIIARASGGRGPNDEYLYNTAQHMGELGIEDPDMDWLVKRVRNISADLP